MQEELRGLELIEHWAELENERRRLENELKAIKARMDKIHDDVMKTFEETGLQNVNVRGLTIYLHRQLWAGREDGVTVEEVCDALKVAGLSDLVAERFNHQTLSAYVRELEAQGEPLPAPLQGKVKVSEVFSVRSRSAQ